MINTLGKALCLCGAIAGGGALSQYPAFAQQYIQRLGGQVDALAEVVEDFDRSALEAGLTRSEALEEMAGGTFLDARADDMRRTFARHVILTDQLARLRAASPMQRVRLAPQLRDAPTLAATWGDFEPAMPLSTAGAATTVAGGVLGWGLVAALLALVARPFHRRQAAPAPLRPAARARVDPPLHRIDTGPALPRPRLMGETRP